MPRGSLEVRGQRRSAKTGDMEPVQSENFENSVIVVAPPETPAYEDTVASFKRAGLDVEQANGLADLPNLLRRHRRTTIVVCDSSMSERAEDVLSQLARMGRSTPVIVVVNSPDSTAYHDLMRRGVWGYYELSEGPELIARAVRHFARVHAA